MTFATPWAFLLLLLVPLILYRYFFRSPFEVRTGKLLFSSVGSAAAAGSSLRTRLMHLPIILRIITLILLILALARPLEGMEKIYDASRGIAIEIVLDRSSSMKAEMVFDGQRLNRLEVAKRVLLEFVRGNGKDLTGRPNDLIGFITFARYADTSCPLTLAHDALPSFVNPVSLVDRKSEDGTAIGDALALAAARLQKVEESLKQQSMTDKSRETTYEIKNKIIILLTDGEQNAGKRSPREAAELAKKWGIKIYTIGIGGRESLLRVPSLFGMQAIPTGPGVNKEALTALARETGGIFKMAEDGDSLRTVYGEINKLKKSEIESVRYVDYKEKFMIFALPALFFLGLEVLLRTTWLRRIP